MRTITLGEAASALEALVRGASAAGEGIVIAVDGKPAAAIVPVHLLEELEWLRTRAGRWGATEEDPLASALAEHVRSGRWPPYDGM